MTEKLDVIISLLKTNWNSSNTMSKVPFIGRIWDNKSGNKTNQNFHYVDCYPSGSSDTYWNLDRTAKDRERSVTCRIRTGTYDGAVKIKNEITRILDANNTSDGSDYSFLEVNGTQWITQDRNKPLYMLAVNVRIVQLSVIF
jgi:hypothetical protein